MRCSVRSSESPRSARACAASTTSMRATARGSTRSTWSTTAAGRSHTASRSSPIATPWATSPGSPRSPATSARVATSPGRWSARRRTMTSPVSRTVSCSKLSCAEATSARACCSSWTSIASRSSTTASVTRSATTSCAAVAERLTAAVRPDDVVARFGGDEFVVLCRDVVDDSVVDQLVRRIGDAVGTPCTVQHQQVHVGASIGIARSQPGGPVDGLAFDPRRGHGDVQRQERRSGPRPALRRGDA